ncbi:MAG: hypothetical protein HYX40_09210 [Sphingobacteriales bacterium]|nr:hypothetical protein [Sphingobacteriales bacterium]
MIQKRAEWVIIVVPGIVLAAYILTRIFTVSFTHDETQTCLTYAPFPLTDIVTNRNYDPNNHIFHTLMVKLFSAVFGIHQWSVRLPNFIGFILFYSFGVSLLKKNITNPWSLLAAIILLCFNPYLLDFFGLARGYGLSCGFMVCSIYYASEYVQAKRLVHLILSLTAGILAAYTQFTLLNFFAALIMFFGIYMFLQKLYSLKLWGSIVVSIILLGTLVYSPIKALIVHNTVPHWGENDFIKDTVFSLARCLNYNQPVLFIDNAIFLSGILVTAFAGSLAVVFMYRKNYRQQFYQFLLLTAMLLCGSIFILFVQNKLLGNSYLISRTALFLFPLFILFVITAVAYLFEIQKSRYPVFLVLLGALALTHFIRNANLKATFEWYYNANDRDIITYLEKKHNEGEITITLNTHWHFHPTIYFYKESLHLDWLILVNYHKEVRADNSALYYYTYSSEASFINSCYSPVEQYGNKERVLYKCHE